MLSFDDRVEKLMDLDPSLSYEEAVELVLQEDEDEEDEWEDEDIYGDEEDYIENEDDYLDSLDDPYWNDDDDDEEE